MAFWVIYSKSEYLHVHEILTSDLKFNDCMGIIDFCFRLVHVFSIVSIGTWVLNTNCAEICVGYFLL